MLGNRRDAEQTKKKGPYTALLTSRSLLQCNTEVLELTKDGVIEFGCCGNDNAPRGELFGANKFGGNAQRKAYGFGHSSINIINTRGDERSLNFLAMSVKSEPEPVPHHDLIFVALLKGPFFIQDKFQDARRGATRQTDRQLVKEP